MITKGCESNGGGGVKLLENFLVAAPRDVSLLARNSFVQAGYTYLPSRVPQQGFQPIDCGGLASWELCAPFFFFFLVNICTTYAFFAASSRFIFLVSSIRFRLRTLDVVGFSFRCTRNRRMVKALCAVFVMLVGAHAC